MSQPTADTLPTPAPPSPSKKGRKKKKDREEKKTLAHQKTNVELEQAPKVVTKIFAGNEYSGIIQTDMQGVRSLEGAAQYTWQSGIKYEGPFVGSQIEGRGKFTWPDGSTYEGEVDNGKRHGDGTYLASDGVTKYEGQWVQGKRHGTGRILYDTNGDAHYFGQWEDGWKHGDGRQVWPSGNVYEGQWKYGKMAGQGTMTWKDTGLVEVYTGTWEDDRPQGLGTHTWNAPEPKSDVTIGKGPTQQMNNRYHGEWNQGVRHGEGTFFYGNGAKYCGNWNDNVKHGQGIYTFDTGKVYSGPFTNDHMKDYYSDPSESAHNGLNIGADDNPVRRCIDVSDLEIIAIRPDIVRNEEKEETTKENMLHSRVALAEGTGYDEIQEVMREVHNMLLRYLGELKETYSNYRKILPRASDDPFVLSMHQVWMFARDFDLLTPLSNLSSFNRCILHGPRHHQEAADEDEIQDVRPLTPRKEMDPRRSVVRGGTSNLLTEAALAEAGEDRGPTTVDASLSFRGSEVGSEVSSDYENDDVSRAPTAEEGPRDSRGQSPSHEDRVLSPVADEDGTEKGTLKTETSRLSGIRYSAFAPSVSFLSPLHTRFWRKSGMDLVNIHSPDTTLLFRHFLEIFVRVAIARYSNESGLEQQVRRLFKETLASRFGTAAGDSAHIFGFLLDPDIGEVFGSFHETLWDMFKENAVGEGMYGPPQWAKNTEDAETPYSSEAPDASRTQSKTLEAVGDAGQKSPGMTRQVSPEAKPVQMRASRRGWCGQQRRVHVQARMDVTVRVKDVLHILNSAGLIVPPRNKERYPPFAADINSVVFPEMSKPDTAASKISHGMTPINDLGGLKGLLGDPGDISPVAELPVDNTGADYSSETRKPLGRGSIDGSSVYNSEFQDPSSRISPTKQSKRPSSIDIEEQVELAQPEPVAPPDVSDSEVLACDFTLSTMELLQLVMEVSSVESTQKLVWSVRGEAEAKEEQVGILDFLETELAFCEFQRLLLRISETKTKDLDPALSANFPLHRRLEGFLRHVLFGASETKKETLAADSPARQQSPEAAEEAGEEPASGLLDQEKSLLKEGLSRQQSPGPDRQQSPEAGVAGGQQSPQRQQSPTDDPAEAAEAIAEASPSQEPRPFTFWLGFDDGDIDGLEELSAPRAWPGDYETSIYEW